MSSWSFDQGFLAFFEKRGGLDGGGEVAEENEGEWGRGGEGF